MNVAFLLSVLFAAAPLTEGARPMTLREALQLAATQNPQLKEPGLAVRSAEAGVSAAGALPNPSVGVSYGADDPRLFESFEARLPLFGQRGAAVAAARAEIPVAKAELAAKRLVVLAQARRAYSALALAQARLQGVREAAQVARTLGGMARAKFDLGTASEFEVEQAALAASRAEFDVLDAEGVLGEAQTMLAALLAVGPPERLEAADPLWPLPAPPEPEELASAVSGHPEVLSQRATRDAALARAHEQRVSLVPVPVVSLEVQHFPVPGLPVGFRGGLLFDIPLFTWNGGAIAVEQARAAQAAAAAQAREYTLTQELNAARIRYDTAARRARFFHEQQLPSARRVLELAQVAYRLGRTPLSNILQAQAELARTQLDAFDADKTAWDALADLEEASGVTF